MFLLNLFNVKKRLIQYMFWLQYLLVLNEQLEQTCTFLLCKFQTLRHQLTEVEVRSLDSYYVRIQSLIK